LAEAHRRGVVHRDIKSTNLWVLPRGQVKIVDFGLAKSMREDPAASEDSPTEGLTLTGMTVGTVHYMSPEQALGREVDPRSDIFSFGVVLYETATGKQPFGGRTNVETFDQILHADPPPPSTLNPELPFELDRIVLKALRKDPEERYQTAADLVVDLRAVRRALESGQHPVSGSVPAASGPHRAATPSAGVPVASSAVGAAATTFLGDATPSGGVAAKRQSTLGSVVLVVSAMLAVVSLTLGIVALAHKKRAAATATVQASGRPAVAVVPFENGTGEARYNWYAENTADLLRVVVAQLGNLDVISKQRLYDVLREVRGKTGDAGTLDPSVATEVARRSNARLMIRGEALLVGGSVILTAEVVDVASGRLLGAEKVTGVDEENMLEKVDELGRLLGERLKAIS
jgi:TolB-like protein